MENSRNDLILLIFIVFNLDKIVKFFKKKTVNIPMSSKNSGFTLVELLVSIGIVSILSLLGIQNFNELKIRFYDADRLSAIRMLQVAIEGRDNKYDEGLLGRHLESGITTFTYENVTLEACEDSYKSNLGYGQAETSLLAWALPNSSKHFSYVINAWTDRGVSGGNIVSFNATVYDCRTKGMSQYIGNVDSIITRHTNYTPYYASLCNSCTSELFQGNTKLINYSY